MSEIVCKYCGGKTFFTKKKNTNTGLYCSGCGNWVKWLSKKDLQSFTQTGKVYEKPEPVKNSVNTQANLASYIAHLEGLVTSLQNTVSYSEADNERNNEKVSIYLSTISALENIKDGKQWYDK